MTVEMEYTLSLRKLANFSLFTLLALSICFMKTQADEVTCADVTNCALDEMAKCQDSDAFVRNLCSCLEREHPPEKNHLPSGCEDVSNTLTCFYYCRSEEMDMNCLCDCLFNQK